MTNTKSNQKLKLVQSIFKKCDEIPENWERVNLEKLTPKNEKGSIKMGPFGSNLKIHELLDEGKIKTLWIENLVNNKLDFHYKKFITEEKYKELETFTVKPNDILFTMMGTLGRVSIVPENIGKAIISSHLLKITLDQNLCISKFLFYFLLSNFITRQLLRESRGIVMQGLNTGIVKSLLIDCPSIPEQQKIASILSNAYDSIQKTTKQIEEVKQLKNGLMQKLLTEGIGHTKFKKVPFVYQKFLEIPANWDFCPLSKVFDLKNGFTFKSEYFVHSGKKIVLTPGNFHVKSGLYFKKENTTWYDGPIPEGFTLKNGDFLIVMTDLTRSAAILGNACILNHDKPILHNQRIGKAIFKTEIEHKYLYYVLNSGNYKKQILRTAAGTTVIHTSSKRILSCMITIPPIPEQQKIASILSNVDSQIESLESKKTQQEKLKQGLMQKLLTGQKRVKF